MAFLDKIPEGSTAHVVSVGGGVGMRRRLAEIGIFPGASVRIERNSGGPVVVTVLGSRFAIGRGQASRIEVMQ